MSQTQRHAQSMHSQANFHVSGGIRKSAGGKAPVSYAGKTIPGRSSGVQREFTPPLAVIAYLASGLTHMIQLATLYRSLRKSDDISLGLWHCRRSGNINAQQTFC
jgi:hypothetical protein